MSDTKIGKNQDELKETFNKQKETFNQQVKKSKINQYMDLVQKEMHKIINEEQAAGRIDPAEGNRLLNEVNKQADSMRNNISMEGYIEWITGMMKILGFCKQLHDALVAQRKANPYKITKWFSGLKANLLAMYRISKDQDLGLTISIENKDGFRIPPVFKQQTQSPGVDIDGLNNTLKEMFDSWLNTNGYCSEDGKVYKLKENAEEEQATQEAVREEQPVDNHTLQVLLDQFGEESSATLSTEEQTIKLEHPESQMSQKPGLSI